MISLGKETPGIETTYSAISPLPFYLLLQVWGRSRPVGYLIGVRSSKDCIRILQRYGNHPSFLLMAYGNEPSGGNQKRFLGDLVNYWKEKDPRLKKQIILVLGQSKDEQAIKFLKEIIEK